MLCPPDKIYGVDSFVEQGSWWRPRALIPHPSGVLVELRLGSTTGKLNEEMSLRTIISLLTSMELQYWRQFWIYLFFLCHLTAFSSSPIKPLWNNSSRNCKIYANAHFAWWDCWKSWMFLCIQLTWTPVSDCSHIQVTSQVLSMSVWFKLICAANCHIFTVFHMSVPFRIPEVGSSMWRKLAWRQHLQGFFQQKNEWSGIMNDFV